MLVPAHSDAIASVPPQLVQNSPHNLAPPPQWQQQIPRPRSPHDEPRAAHAPATGAVIPDQRKLLQPAAPQPTHEALLPEFPLGSGHRHLPHFASVLDDPAIHAGGALPSEDKLLPCSTAVPSAAEQLRPFLSEDKLLPCSAAVASAAERLRPLGIELLQQLLLNNGGPAFDAARLALHHLCGSRYVVRNTTTLPMDEPSMLIITIIAVLILLLLCAHCITLVTVWYSY